MPKLILLRHATAERLGASQTDHQRALTPAGRVEAAAAGREMATLVSGIDLVLCSTAQRTTETLDEVLPSLPTGPEVRLLDRLFDDPDYPSLIRREGGEAEAILVVGHNPFIQDTVVSLAADIQAGGGAGPARRFPPAAFAVLQGDAAWTELAPGGLQLERFVLPG
jgi:phosphohistidine phosphatase